MSIDLEALEKLARAATPGPWERCGHDNLRSMHPAMGRAGSNGALRYWDGSGWEHEGDLDYIAAVSPDVVLALIKQLKDAGSSWPYCGRCDEGEDAVECEGCGETGCDVCVSRSGRCDLCRKVGIT